jgi:hypothetical protein
MSWFNGKEDPKLNPTGADLDKAITESEKVEARKLVIKTSPGYTVPDHYLVKMSKADINKWTRMYYIFELEKCPRNKGITTQNCLWSALPLAVIENANLAFVNGFTDYNYVKKAYEEAKAFIEWMPADMMNQSFKSHLKNVGKGALSMVIGLVTAGPIGLYVGAATAAGNQIAEQRAKKAAADAAILNPQANKILQAVEAKATQDAVKSAEQNKQQQNKMLLLLGGAILVAGGIYYASTD